MLNSKNEGAGVKVASRANEAQEFSLNELDRVSGGDLGAVFYYGSDAWLITAGVNSYSVDHVHVGKQIEFGRWSATGPPHAAAGHRVGAARCDHDPWSHRMLPMSRREFTRTIDLMVRKWQERGR